MEKRIEKGFELYQKGNVTLIFSDNEEIQFEVKSKKVSYLVSILGSVVRCNQCEDYEFRFQRESNAKNGSFLCSHCFAALFKLAEIRGVKQSQATLEFTDKKVIA
jgi:formylmethanofuran dehydrogenase subunit E